MVLLVHVLVHVQVALVHVLAAVDNYHEDQEKQGSSANKAEIQFSVKKTQYFSRAFPFPEI